MQTIGGIYHEKLRAEIGGNGRKSAETSGNWRNPTCAIFFHFQVDVPAGKIVELVMKF